MIALLDKPESFRPNFMTRRQLNPAIFLTKISQLILNILCQMQRTGYVK